MGFTYLDYAIVGIYLIGVTVIGTIISGSQRSSRDYFLGGKEMSWWSVGFSIVASETSTLTFISIPGLAFRSDMHFLQLVVGYFIGRFVFSRLHGRPHAWTELIFGGLILLYGVYRLWAAWRFLRQMKQERDEEKLEIRSKP